MARVRRGRGRADRAGCARGADAGGGARMTRFADIAGALVAAGYQPIPIKPNEKAPAVSAWTEYAFTPDDAARYRSCGVGLLCGELRAIDIDVRNEQVSARLEALAKSMLGIDGKAPRR